MERWPVQFRQMVELDPQTILIGGIRFHLYKNGIWRVKEGSNYFSAGAENYDMASDDKGHIWFMTSTSKEPPIVLNLVRFSPEDEQCDTFNITHSYFRFDFLEDGQMVFATKGNIYQWDKQSLQPALLLKRNFQDAFINQLFADREGFIWLATDMGLLKIDPKTAREECIELIPRQTTNVMRVLQDKKGRLWVATVMNGVLIYDPASGKTQVIDRTSGLSNDIVVSLLEDNDGDIWAGTFCGISVISPEGVVLGRLYEEDGLANNECNRWSALKMKDGRLCFGSVGGVSIIDPALWKSPVEGYRPPSISLTTLYSDALEQGLSKEDHFTRFGQKQRIILPATNRDLKATYVLSNYAAPEKSIFAYQLAGVEKEWHYIGNQHQLTLNALPAGSYNILIKGSDGRGQWSDPPIVIPVSVHEYFYKNGGSICCVPCLS